MLEFLPPVLQQRDLFARVRFVEDGDVLVPIQTGRFPDYALERLDVQNDRGLSLCCCGYRLGFLGLSFCCCRRILRSDFPYGTFVGRWVVIVIII
jgi:hypothetical protein